MRRLLLALALLGLAVPALAQGPQITVPSGGGNVPITTAIGAGSSYGSVSVGTTATLVRSATSARTSIALANNGTATVYCGTSSSVVTGSAGTASSGFPLAVGSARVYDRYTGAIYCISGSAAQDVRYDEFSTP